MRVVRHLGARTVPEDDAKPLIIVPTFPGETVKSVHLSAYALTLSDTDGSNPSEMNWYGISVPWPIVYVTDMLAKGTVPSFTTVADFDSLFEMWLLDSSEDGSEYYGGDVDADPEVVSGEEVPTDEELIDSGPIGVHRWFSREILMRPYAAAGNDTVRFGDDFEAFESGIGVSKWGGLLMFGVVRHDVAAETNFNVEMDDVTSIQAMGLLQGGDYTKIKAIIEGNTAALGDYVRTMLFGGDHYAEASTIVATSAKAYVKARIAIDGPLRRQR